METKRWDAAEFLNCPEAIIAHVEAVLEDGDPKLIALVLNNVARQGPASGCTDRAKRYRLGDRALGALGLELTAKAA